MTGPLLSRRRMNDEWSDTVARTVSRMKNQLHEPLALADLARTEHFSPFHFHRVFRETTTLPPARFLAALRMAQARRLLAHSRLTVAEISTEVGYRSTGTFTTQFTRLVGAPPERFRRIARALSDRSAASLLSPATGTTRLVCPAEGTARPADSDQRTLLGLEFRPVRADRVQYSHWTVAPAQTAARATTPTPTATPTAAATPTSAAASGAASAPGSGRPEHHLWVMVVDPGATPTEALVDNAEGSYLIGHVRYVPPPPGQPSRRISVQLRRPRLTDPPILSVTPLLWLGGLAANPAQLSTPPDDVVPQAGPPATAPAPTTAADRSGTMPGRR